MNVADTEVVRSVLAGAGYREAPAASEADVVLVNTCAIRERAEDKIWCRLGTFRALREQRRAKDRCAHVLQRSHLLGVCCCPVYQQRVVVVGPVTLVRACHTQSVHAWVMHRILKRTSVLTCGERSAFRRSA